MAGSKRLTADSWVEAGLAALEESGFHTLKADILARKLGVSRGSFYWHFADVDQFHRAVIDRWRQTSTEDVIFAVSQQSPNGQGLGTLLKRAFGAQSSLENRMRSWAMHDQAAADAVAQVDARRRAFLADLLKRAGAPDGKASLRAEIIYWAYLGACLSDSKPSGQVLQEAVFELTLFGTVGGG